MKYPALHPDTVVAVAQPLAFGSHLVHAAVPEKYPYVEQPVAQTAVVLSQRVHKLFTVTYPLEQVTTGALQVFDPTKHARQEF